MLELEGKETTPLVVAAARRGSCTYSSEHSMHVFVEPMGPRSDSTMRGRIDRYDLNVQRSGFHRARSHSLFHHSLVFEARSEGRNWFIENLGPRPATVV